MTPRLRPPVRKIPAPVKVWTVGAGATAGAEIFDLGDVADWTEDGIRSMAFAVAQETIEEEAKFDNDPLEIRIDGSLRKPLTEMRSTVDVIFGVDVRPSMRAFEQLVLTNVSSRVAGVHWIWQVHRSRRRFRQLQEQLVSRGPVTLEYGDVLRYVPRGPGEMNIAHQNIRYIDGQGPSTFTRGRKKGETRVDRKGRARKRPGFIAKTSTESRRSPLIRGFYRVTAIQSFKRARRAAPVKWFDPTKGEMTDRPLGRQSWTSPRTGEKAFFQGAYGFLFRRSLR